MTDGAAAGKPREYRQVWLRSGMGIYPVVIPAIQQVTEKKGWKSIHQYFITYSYENKHFYTFGSYHAMVMIRGTIVTIASWKIHIHCMSRWEKIPCHLFFQP